MYLISKLVRLNLVRGIPRIKFEKDHICDTCQHGKQFRESHPSISDTTTSKLLELLHLDLFGPTQVASLDGMKYCFVIVDDYSRFSWVFFLSIKVTLVIYLKRLAKELRMREVFLLSQFIVITGVSLATPLRTIAYRKATITLSHPQEHHNPMVLSRGKT